MVTEVACGNNSSGPEWTAGTRRVKIYLQRGTKSLKQKDFGLWTVSIWNNLPEEVVNATSMNMLKRRLDKHWENQEIRNN